MMTGHSAAPAPDEPLASAPALDSAAIEGGLNAGDETPRISACIVCRNEADKLGPCIESVAWADETIVMDLSSSDGIRSRGASTWSTGDNASSGAHRGTGAE